MRRIGLALIMVMGIVVSAAGPAHACSCALVDPREGLERSDGAFVGTGVSTSEGPTENTLTFHFDVEAAVKGDIGTEVDVVTPVGGGGGGCGLEVATGQRVALLLSRDGDQWWGYSCSMVDPDELLAAAQPLPPPSGEGPVRFLMGGAFGDSRVVALDEAGRTLAYGAGQGDTYRIAMCPGMRRFLELVTMSVRQQFTLAVRDTSTLEVVREVKIPGGVLDVPGNPGVNVDDLLCRDEEAEESLVLVDEWPEGSGRSHVLRVTGEVVEDALALDGQYGFLDGDRVVVYRGPDPAHIDSVVAVDMATGEDLVFTDLPEGAWYAAPSPDGTRVAGIIHHERAPSEIFVMDAGVTPPVTRVATLGTSEAYGIVAWLDDGALGYFPWSEGELQTFDVELRPIAALGGWTGQVVLGQGEAFGIGDDVLLRATLPAGPIEDLRTIDFGEAHTVVLVSGDIQVRPAVAPATEPSTSTSASPEAPPADAAPAVPAADHTSRGWMWWLLVPAGGAGVLVARLRRGRRDRERAARSA